MEFRFDNIAVEYGEGRRAHSRALPGADTLRQPKMRVLLFP